MQPTPLDPVASERLSHAGKVFAVTWQGPRPPDLRQLFGSYFEPFQSAAAAQSRPGMHRQVSVAQADFVVHAVALLRVSRQSLCAEPGPSRRGRSRTEVALFCFSI